MASQRTSNAGAPQRLGRPRDRKAHQKILDTALSLLESASLQDLTIESIAKNAGVSKVTIYRWWDSKALLVIEAFTTAHMVRTPLDINLPPRLRLAKHIASLTKQYSELPGRVVAQIIADGQNNPEVMRAFREQFFYGRRAVVREVVEEWRQSGELDIRVDVETFMDFLYSPIYLRLLMGHRPLDLEFVKAHLNFIYELLKVEPLENDEWNIIDPGF